MLSSLRNGARKLYISRVEVFLFFILLTFGIPMLLLIPPGAGYDEEDHLVRVWELSVFSFIPGQLSARELQYPTMFRDLAYRQQAVEGIVDAGFWGRYAGASLSERGYVHRKLNTRSAYSPALLLPQALTMRYLGRLADLPALPVFYLCRFAGLFSYLLLVWLAIRWIPFGKWILLVLAASPMALFQAATLTADTISNGIGFFFIAGCLRVAHAEEIGWRETGTLVFLVFLLFLGKLNLIPLVLLPFLLLVPSQYTKRGAYPLLLGAVLILFIVEVVGWINIASTPFPDEVYPTAQLFHILENPFRFLQMLPRDLLTNGLIYLEGWINGYGYYYWTPPQAVAALFLLGLGCALIAASPPDRAGGKLRIALLLVFAASSLATVVLMYTSFTPVGLDRILGVQGRYFIPLALPLFLALPGLPWIKRLAASSPRWEKWTAGFLTLALSLNVAGIFLSFYVPCGSAFYQTGLCYRPLYTDFTARARLSEPLSSEISLAQEIHPACDGLAEVRVWLIPSAHGDKGSTRFILKDPSNDRTLMDHSIPNAQLPEESWHSLPFDPDWASAGKRYILEILSTDTPSGQGLRFLYSSGSEADLGALYENSAPLQEHIVLQYGCTAGLRRIWLTGRP